VVEFAAWAGRSVIILVSRAAHKKRFYEQPGVLKKFSNILKEKHNTQCPGNDELDQITPGARVDV